MAGNPLAKRASRVRAKIRKGIAPSAEETAFLSEYDANKAPSGRRPQPMPLYPLTAEATELRPSQAGSTVGVDVPASMGVASDEPPVSQSRESLPETPHTFQAPPVYQAPALQAAPKWVAPAQRTAPAPALAAHTAGAPCPVGPDCPGCKAATMGGTKCGATGAVYYPKMTRMGARTQAAVILGGLRLAIKALTGEEVSRPKKPEVDEFADAWAELVYRRFSVLGAHDDITSTLGHAGTFTMDRWGEATQIKHARVVAARRPLAPRPQPRTPASGQK
jgi:hypothetical protein